jgi:4-cresol dehydrogenase (hydroxylating)
MLGVVETALHIANRTRTEITVGPVLLETLREEGRYPDADLRDITKKILDLELRNAWTVVGGIMGSRTVVYNTYRYMKRAMNNFAEVKLITSERIEWGKRLAGLFGFLPTVRRKRIMLDALEPFFGLAQGFPTDAGMGSVYWPLDRDCADTSSNPDHGNCGLLGCLPIVPLEGRAVAEAVEIIEGAFSRHGFTAYITFNIVSRAALEGVIGLAFDRDDEQEVARAHECQDECQKLLNEHGYLPYRVGIQSMDSIVDPEKGSWRTVAGLKQILDPNHVIAPGRYNSV